VAPTIERIGSGCTSNLMRVLIRLTAPEHVFANKNLALKQVAEKPMVALEV